MESPIELGAKDKPQFPATCGLILWFVFATRHHQNGMYSNYHKRKQAGGNAASLSATPRGR
jgi:hypothetical protein